jgi:hypothetical protein
MKTDTVIDIKEIESEIAAAKEVLSQLERQREEIKMEKIKNLPAEMGVETIDEIISMLMGSKETKEVKTYHNLNYESKQGKKIPKAIREHAVKLVEQENLTGKEIVARLGISLPSLNTIKRQFGLTRPYSRS